jgi:hypothetical protein
MKIFLILTITGLMLFLGNEKTVFSSEESTGSASTAEDSSKYSYEDVWNKEQFDPNAEGRRNSGTPQKTYDYMLEDQELIAKEGPEAIWTGGQEEVFADKKDPAHTWYAENERKLPFYSNTESDDVAARREHLYPKTIPTSDELENGFNQYTGEWVGGAGSGYDTETLGEIEEDTSFSWSDGYPLVPPPQK